MEAREAEWAIDANRTFVAWAFNGHVPGPTLEGHVGDVLEVKLTNRLPEPTTIHWHGLRLPAPMDGTDLVQKTVAPGETFTYRFKLTDAGTFWYHSHTNETVQMERTALDIVRVEIVWDPRSAERVIPALSASERAMPTNDIAPLRLAQAELEAERYGDARAACERGLRLARGPMTRMWLLELEAQAWLATGDRVAARRVLGEAKRAAAGIGTPSNKASNLHRIATLEAEAEAPAR